MFTTSIMFITNIPYLFKMTKKNKLSNPKRLIIGAFFAIMIAVLFIASSVPAQAGTGNHQQETGFTSVNYIPQPVLNSNITWSIYHNGWKPLEYNNGTLKGNKTLDTGLSQIYANPITVNPEKIQTAYPKTYDKIQLFNPANWLSYGTGTRGGMDPIQTNASHSFTYSVNESKAEPTTTYILISIPTTDMPTQNTAYDYITMSGNITASTGMYFTYTIANSTMYSNMIAENGTYKSISETAGIGQGNSPAYTNPFWFSVSLKQANLTMGTSNIRIGFQYTIPQSTADKRLSITINNIAMTESPQQLGTENIKNTVKTVSSVQGNAILSNFAPNFVWTNITNNGYTVATTENLRNETISQTSINNGVFTEQATYQGILTLPTAPDLTYSNSYISMKLNITGKQFLVANLNGESYTNTVQSQNNGTYVFGTVNPNSDNSVIIEVEYTTAQWTASSGTPSIWSIAGIEYYWYILLGAGLGLIGLGTGIKSHANSLRVGKR